MPRLQPDEEVASMQAIVASALGMPGAKLITKEVKKRFLAKALKVYRALLA